MLLFKKSANSLVSLGVGQRALITKWLDDMCVKNYTINDDLTIDVNDVVNLGWKNLDEFPNYIKFKIVNHHFSCYGNNLTSLEGCPSEVFGYFDCELNEVKFTIDDVRKVCDVKGNIYV
jgi:hypothetical protein